MWSSRRRSQRHPARREFLSFFRPLRVEPLEGRLAPAVLTVNSLDDGAVNLIDSTITLRDALAAANTDVAVSPGGPSGSGTDEIRFQPGLTGTIEIGQPFANPLTITSNLTISGPGADVLAISGNDLTQVFILDDGLTAIRTVTISSLTITGGLEAAISGGGIQNRENLTLLSSIIRDNFALEGAGIANYGTLSVQNCTISENSTNELSGEGGGGILNEDGTVTVISSTISDNLGEEGGGIANYGGTMTVQNSTINENSVIDNGSLGGGGILNFNGTMTVLSSTISNNDSGSDGGGIASGGALTVVNSTISGNRANRDGGGIAYYNDGLILLSTTITQNHANNDNFIDGAGGGIALFNNNNDAATLHNTIVVDNYKGSGTTTEDNIDVGNSTGVNAASTNNLIGTGGSGGLTNGVNGNQVGIGDPKLGPLAENGGPTKTHALVGGSAAVNTGNNAQVPGSSNFDQRGAPFARISGPTVDIGAVEAQLQPLSLIVDTDVDEADGNGGPGDLSLREAIDRTNANPGEDTISFSAGFFSTPRLIVLGLGQLTITDDLTIVGPGANLLNVNGDLASRVFEVDDSELAIKVVKINGLTIAGGSALNAGGILNQENLTLQRSTVRDNFTSGIGGGLLNIGTLTVQSSTISGNSAEAEGGGIVNVNGTMTVVNSTISGNKSNASGGGIFNIGILTVRNSTITGNQADRDGNASGTGGGIRFSDSTVTLHNSIVAGNVRGGGPFFVNDDISAANGSVSNSSTNNLIGTGGSGGLNGTNGNQIGVADAKLGTLADNGGPTKTHELLTGSPAIDRGNNAQTQASVNTDQRGFARIFNDTVDIGAFEVQPEFPWHNFAMPFDVRGGMSVAPDNKIDAGDALAIINYINAFDTAVPDDAVTGLPFGFLDTNMDNKVAPDDALEVINVINAGQDEEPEAVQEPGAGQEPVSVLSEMDNLIGLLALDTASQSSRRRQR